MEHTHTSVKIKMYIKKKLGTDGKITIVQCYVSKYKKVDKIKRKIPILFILGL